MFIINGPSVGTHFTAKWIGNTILQLAPKQPMAALKQYRLMLTRWGARTLDGRVLKSYGGMFASFTTDADPAPTVVSTSPRNGSTGVSRSGPFLIRFDRPMDSSSLLTNLALVISDVETGSRISLNGTTLESEFSIAWSEDNTLLSLVPRRTLKANASYLVRITSADLKSRSGRVVQGISQLWAQFTTGDL
ncbi:MAG TPA: Ig-like domain-containing protein, partial [Candidatus Ozemobacteraceae bacterium]|nr:Ig-like domain-containing protein [Candidatus Ozemobacteraceae bacterium]